MPSTISLRDELGGIDIYLLDQILRGRIDASDVVLDAGCGMGRNLKYLMTAGSRILAADADADAIASVRTLAAECGAVARIDARIEAVEALSFPDASATVVISSAVLHFARDEAHFDAMVRSMWRCLAPGGLFFARLATTIGAEYVGATRLAERIYRLGDGTRRFLADETMIDALTTDLGGQLADPLKTTIVQAQRCMTTWVARKSRPGERRS
ncbi:MAG TPA: class I SAM-dependent methyltransferase [Vicinamibacterales bacterium]|nr:class I SAM-dependent methyltransferase [Vicinamibacterales bacterium]